MKQSKKLLKSVKKLNYSKNKHTFENWTEVAKKELSKGQTFENLFTKTPEGKKQKTKKI